MNRQNLGTALLLGCTFGSAGAASYYLGQVLLHVESEELYALLGFGALYPLLMLILANLSERVKKVVMYITATLAIVGSYVLMLSSPNTIPVLKLDTVSAIMYFMTVGAYMSLFTMGASEVLRRSRDAGFLWLGVGLAIGCAIVGIVVWASIFGWLYMIMVVNYIIPVAMLLYFLLYPEGTEGETVMRRPQTKEVMAQFVVRDTWKGFKIAMYTLLVGVGVIATVGVNGLAMPQEDYFTAAPVFWSLAAAGSFAAAVVAKLVLGKIIGMPSGARKARSSNIAWLILACAQSIALICLALAEFFVPGFHLSVASDVVGGLVLGFNIGLYLAVLSVQHPPRSNYAFYMFNSFFIVFAMAVSSYLRSINVDIDQFYDEIAGYVLYIIAALSLVLVLLVVNQIITIVKTSKAARDAPSITAKVAEKPLSP
jgi:MFS family permease